MNNKKGFTLIELLAVIVILAILMLLALPNALKIMENARKSAFETEARSYLKAAELKYTEKSLGTSAGTTMYFSNDGTDNDSCSDTNRCNLDINSKSDYTYDIVASADSGTLKFKYTIENSKYLAKTEDYNTLNSEIVITKKDDSAIEGEPVLAFNLTGASKSELGGGYSWANNINPSTNNKETDNYWVEIYYLSITPDQWDAVLDLPTTASINGSTIGLDSNSWEIQNVSTPSSIDHFKIYNGVLYAQTVDLGDVYISVTTVNGKKITTQFHTYKRYIEIQNVSYNSSTKKLDITFLTDYIYDINDNFWFYFTSGSTEYPDEMFDYTIQKITTTSNGITDYYKITINNFTLTGNYELSISTNIDYYTDMNVSF